MQFKKTIQIDLADRGKCETLGEAAVSGDSGARALVFALVEAGKPWPVPEGTRAALAFQTDLGSSGEYDTMPDGTDAAEIDGNLVTVRLVDEILARSGKVALSLVLRDDRLRRLSSHPVMLTVSQGLGDVPGLPSCYYRVRDLAEINEAIGELSGRVDAVDTDAVRQAAQEAREAAEAAKHHAEAVDPEAIHRHIGEKGDDMGLDPDSGKVRLISDGQFIGEGFDLTDGGGLSFDGGYVDGENLLHLTMEGEDIEGFTPIVLPVGGGGVVDSGSRIVVSMVTEASLVAAEPDDEVWLEFSFTSLDAVSQTPTGSGTMEIAVGGAVKRTAPIEQGNIRVNIRPYLSAGANSVVLTVTDAYGGTVVRRLSVTLETLSLSWNLEDTARTENALTIHLNPVGNGTKTIHLQLDGEDFDTFEVTTSGRRVTRTLPVQSHGGHIVTAWAQMEAAGTMMTSDVLSCAVAWVTDAKLPAIACVEVPQEHDQFSSVQLIHRVIDPRNNPVRVRYLVNGTLFREVDVDQSEQVWSYRLSAAQDTTLSILCGGVRHDVTIRVNAIGMGVEEVTEGLVLKVDPTAMADLESWTEGGYSFTLSEGFDHVNGGLCTDEQGVRCIRITAGDALTLNYPMFARDARSGGLAAKLIYAVRNPTAKHCTAISCIQNGVGLEIQPNNVYLRGNQTVCKLSVCEDEKTELDLNIQPDSADGIMFLWEGCSTFAYMKYAADESFTHTQDTGITFGCEDADVYLYLASFYDRDLTDTERLANHAAHGVDTAQILDRQDRNDIYDSTGSVDIDKCAAKNPDCHHIVISAERMTKGKKDEVPGSIRHIYRAGGPEHQWSAPVSMFVQGTSSVEHAETAGPNINFYFPGGVTLENGTVMTDGYAMNGRDKSIPVLELCYKKNIASEDHIVNRATAEWYNRYQPSVRPERVENPLLRDCLDSTMCAVYFHNTGSSAVQVGPDLVPPGATVFFGLGNLCSNKDSVGAFGYHPIVIEVKNNTEPQVRFKSDDLSGDNWKNNYEFRHLDTDLYTEDQAKAEWQRVQTFLYETDCMGATDVPLAQSVTIDGVSYVRDSAEYRRARWLAESDRIFDKRTLTFHHNITLFLLLRDNRAKNMFWSLDPSTGKWGLWFNWDNDTGLCRNNDGYIDIEPGYMDFDTLGTGDVFNGADNAVFANLREWEWERLKADYMDRESAGAWDIDRFYDYAMESQESICEALWIEDAAHNAIRTMQNLGTTAYLERATGRLRLHIRKALTFQKVLVDSYYCASAATGQSSAFRGYTPSNWGGVAPNGRLAVTTYTNMYVNALAGNTAYRVRATEGIPVELDISASLNNTEIYFRHAPWIQDLGDLAGLYLGQFEASSLKRVRRLLIGSENPDYYNTNFTQASFDNCVRLETLNLGGLRNAARSFDFRPNLYLKDLYTRGSGITGVTFAREGRLETVKLNAVKSLTVDSLNCLDNFSMPTYAQMQVLSVRDTPALDTKAMADGAKGLQRVRLIGIDWSCENADTLIRLTACAGRDDDGRDIPTPVVTGKAHVQALTQEELDTIRAAFPELEVTHGAIVPSYTVQFLVDGVVVNTQRVAQGGTVKNPVTYGMIATPTRQSSVEYAYSFTGWDASLQNITADTQIHAVFSAQDRYYTVRFWYDDMELELAQEWWVIAHGSCTFTNPEPDREGMVWMGWDAHAGDVVSDMNIHAVYIVPKLPESVPKTFDFLYSDDPADDSAFTLAEFMGILEAGVGKTYFQVGDRIKMVIPRNDVFTDSDIVLQVEGFNHFCLAEGAGFAGVVFGMTGVMNAGHMMNINEDHKGSNEGGWPGTVMREFLNNTVLPQLPHHWRRLMKRVQVRSSAGGTRTNIVTSGDILFLPAVAEVYADYAGVTPYNGEVDSAAEGTVFAGYTDHTSRKKYLSNGTGIVSNWWLRSPVPNSDVNYHYVRGAEDNNGGRIMESGAQNVFGFSWMCCMGVACV